MARAFVSVGSNIQAEANISRALKLLRQRVEILRVSTFYYTPAINRPRDPPFVNGVIETVDASTAADFKSVLRETEAALGRDRSPGPYAPRSIDLDLLLYGELVRSSGELVLPHPDIRERPFVAIALLELAPDLVLPDSGTPLRSILKLLRPYPMEPLSELTARLRKEVVHGS
jgi:2-amino-4-hydroxy-6-hydroxymethyldihydropteridine diphosphokinase